MTNQKKLFTSSFHAVVCVNSYFIGFKTQKVVQLGKHGRNVRIQVTNRKTKYLVHVQCTYIKPSGVSEYCKS